MSVPTRLIRRSLHTSAVHTLAAPPPLAPGSGPPPPRKPLNAAPAASPATPPPAPSLHLPIPKGDKVIHGLNKPLGVPDIPTPREFGWWELIKPSDNEEFKKAKMQAILADFKRSNLGNIMESWKTGGKGWIAPKTVFKEEKALYMPDLFGHTLSSPKIKVHTSNLCKGKITLIGLGGTTFSNEQVSKFVNPIDERLGAREDFQLAHVSLQSTSLKAFLSTLFASNLRASIPRERWDNYIVSTQNIKSTLEDQCLGISNILAGHVYLVDENLKVRWAGCGDPTDEELSSLLVAGTMLLDRLDSKKGRRAPTPVIKTAGEPSV